MARTTTRRVPVINGGGSVHVEYVVGDLRSITVNGQVNSPDSNGNINILVPERVDVEDAVISGSEAVPTGGAVYDAIEVAYEAAENAALNAVRAEREQRQAADAEHEAAIGGKLDKNAVSVISETAYALLERRGAVDSNKIYFVYEDEAINHV